MRNPRIKQPIRVRIKATKTGNCAQVTSVRKKKAPNASSSPCAKFKTLDDLKIMTKPIAEMP
ncbi:hypothetical protein DS62_08105 [Smithella sp. SC_K08D17]|nr:hypothetical protein DS62_08105 [Smithella sp. SC_K08D17]